MAYYINAISCYHILQSPSFAPLGINVISLVVVFNCSLLTCLNGGTCIEGTAESTCLCSQDYSGDRCQDGVVSCSMPMLCLNGGTCVESTGTTPDQCQCQPGFAGNRCEIDLLFCSTFSCANDGTCIDLAGEQTICLCLPGFTGAKCESNEGNVVNTPG